MGRSISRCKYVEYVYIISLLNIMNFNAYLAQMSVIMYRKSTFMGNFLKGVIKHLYK